MSFYSLNFSEACKIISDLKMTTIWVPPDRDPPHGIVHDYNIVSALLSLPFPDIAIDSMNENRLGIISVYGREASNYFNNLRRVNEYVRFTASDSLLTIHINVKKRILKYLDHEQQRILFETLKGRVMILPLEKDHGLLHSYLNLSFPEDGNIQRDHTMFIARCFHACLLLPNTEGERNISYWATLSDPATHPDPYRIVNGDPGSTAVEISLIDRNGYRDPKIYRRFDTLIDEICSNCLVIDSMKYINGTIKIEYHQLPGNNCTLRKLTTLDSGSEIEGDSRKVQKFIHEHESEFVSKISWRKRLLSDMAYKGLEEEKKWMAYAYFDSNGEILSYLDCKNRVDGSVELGIALTRIDRRDEKLSQSLTYFFQLLFPYSRLFAGTFEENKPMRAVFRATGFERIKYYDIESGQKIDKVKERINKDCPEDYTKCTYSLYFCSESTVFKAYNSVS